MARSAVVVAFWITIVPVNQETTSLCAHCLAPVRARIIIRQGKVFIQKECPEHGAQEELLEEDAGWYSRRMRFDKPGTDTFRETRTERGCPLDCGICPAHAQHTCVALLEVTQQCDLACPICFAESSPETGRHVPLESIERRMDACIAAEGGKADMLQLSGGEPTCHPQILEILARAKARAFRYVMLNTNGLRIAEDAAFVDELAQHRGHFEVYLQFDGFKPETHQQLRGRSLLDVKRKAIDRLADKGIPITLVATIAKGINDDEVGRIAAFGLETKGVRGIAYQPMAYFGRHEGRPCLDRVTLSGVLQRLENQTHGLLRMDDFVPLPCDVERVAITFLYRDGEQFIPLPRNASFEQHLPMVANTLVFDTGDVLKNALKGALSGAGLCNCMSFVKALLPVAPLSLHLQSEEAQARFVTDNTFRITVSSFLDRYNFEAQAMRKECVHVLTPDLRRIPFSAYNILHRAKMETA